jgi:hypothetical protein
MKCSVIRNDYCCPELILVLSADVRICNIRLLWSENGSKQENEVKCSSGLELKRDRSTIKKAMSEFDLDTGVQSGERFRIPKRLLQRPIVQIGYRHGFFLQCTAVKRQDTSWLYQDTRWLYTRIPVDYIRIPGYTRIPGVYTRIPDGYMSGFQVVIPGYQGVIPR